jgi:hypothetical protein
MSARLSVRMEQLGPTGRILIKFDILGFFGNLPRKFKFHYNRKRIMATLNEEKYTVFCISLNSTYNKKCIRQIYKDTRNIFFLK